jgi:hypothetical protein
VFDDGMGFWHASALGVFALVVVLVVVLVVALVTSASRQSDAARRAPGPPPDGRASHPYPGYAAPPAYPGADPMAASPASAAPPPVQGATGPSAAPRTVEQRLADLEDLHRRGVVNADEYAAARIRILGEL